MPETVIGLIGCGHWGQHILRDLKTLGCTVWVTARSERSKARAHAHHADKVFDTIEELLTFPEVQGYIVATPSSSHYGVLKQVLSLRPTVPIFVEKPVTCSHWEAQDILKHHRSHVFVMDKWRYHSGIQKLAEIARTEAMGKVLGIRTERLGWGNPHDDTHTVWHLFPHDLAITLEILGTVPRLKMAHVERVKDRIVGACAVFGDAPWVRCIVSSHWPVRQRRVQLVCEEAIAVLDDAYAENISVFQGPLDSGDIQPNRTLFPVPPTMPLLAELEAFLKFIKGEGPAPKSSMEDACLIVRRIQDVLSNSK